MRPDVKTPRRSQYHHGDLPTVLTETAIELIGEHGVFGFSLAEAARRAGVSPGAPYRHFQDKESLLAAVGVRAYGVLGPRLDAAVASTDDPPRQLALAAVAYVQFAAQEPALFSTLFRAGIDKGRFPELRDASLRAYAGWLAAARAVVGRTGGDDVEQRATSLSIDVLAIAHGHAALLADGQFGAVEQGLSEVEARTRRVVLAYLGVVDVADV